MRYYFAPMEGITSWVFRQAVHDHFGEGIDAYFSPFLVPHEKKPLAGRDLKNILPENNRGMHLIPQILANNAKGFSDLEKAIADLGYEEVNLNLGCPSKTVTGKGRGSGFLKEPEKLDAFLEEIFDHRTVELSVKTRIGYERPEEFEGLLEIYNKYPIKELTIHPRTGIEMYRGTVHLDIFMEALQHSSLPFCYNGDIKNAEDCKKLLQKLEGLRQPESIMIGRGLLENPAIFRELAGGKPAEPKELYAFLEQIRAQYNEIMKNDTQILFKLKEIWTFLKVSCPDSEKALKKLMKSKSLAEYEIYAKEALGI